VNTNPKILVASELGVSVRLKWMIPRLWLQSWWVSLKKTFQGSIGERESIIPTLGIMSILYLFGNIHQEIATI